MAAVAPVKASTPSNFPALLEKLKDEIRGALPRHLDADRMARIALTSFRRNANLGNCDPRSVFAAVLQAAQLGLEPDLLGRSYLLPYGKECQFIPGWKGLVDLVNRTAQATVWTGAVFEGDTFDYGLGDSPYAIHKPSGETSPDKLTHVYAVGRVKHAQWPILEVWSLERVAKHRDRYNKVGRRHYSFQNMEMYSRKVVLLQVLKYLPASPELAAAIALNDAAEIGEQHLTVEDALEGTWSPISATVTPEPSTPVETLVIAEDPPATPPVIPTITSAQTDNLIFQIQKHQLAPQKVLAYAQKMASVKGFDCPSLTALPVPLYDYLLGKLPELARRQPPAGPTTTTHT